MKTHKSDPLKADSDGDGLSDGDEINRFKSDPSKKDTDGDGFSDVVEAFSGSNANDASSTPGAYLAFPFHNASPAEGLDFKGKFLYAVNIGGVETPKIGDAQFVTATLVDADPNIEVDLASEIQVWGKLPDYGSTPDDDGLELIMQSIRHNGQGKTVTLRGLTKGNTYKMQLMFLEQCCARAFDVLVNGQKIADDYAPFVVHGGIANNTAGAAIVYTFVAPSDTLELSLDGEGVTTPSYTDHNEILNAITLEDLGVVAGPPPVKSFKITNIAKALNAVNISIESAANVTYTLEYKASLSDAAWQKVGEVKATGASTTLSDSNAAHLATQGFWRVRTQ